MASDEFDVIVIGSGLGGISAAALLAHSRLRVLLLEQGQGLGGLAHSFTRDGRTFDSAIRVLAEGEMVESLLGYLGAADTCELVPIDHLYRAEFPGMSIFAPAGLQPFVDAHVAAFPHEKRGLREFFGLRRRLFLEATQVPMRVDGLAEMDRLARHFPTLMKYRTATLADVLDDHLDDPRAKAASAALWPYMGAPPSQLSFFAYAQFLGVLVDGPYYCKGSFQRLVDGFATVIRRNGGVIRTGTAVEKVVLTGGRVAGVRTATGETFTAGVVVSNADARHTMDDLIGAENLPEQYVSRLRRLRPSMSACVVYASTTQDVLAHHPAHETFKYRSWDHDETWRDVLGGRPAGMSLSVMTLLDPALAPPGEHLLIATAVAPFQRPDGVPWAQAKDAYADTLLGEFESTIPGLRDNLTFLQCGTPQTIERFTRNHRGATYGWALTPKQIGGKRLSHPTPIPGLYLSGHWTEEGPASFRVILSGITTAQQVLDHLDADIQLPSFKPADIPALAL